MSITMDLTSVSAGWLVDPDASPGRYLHPDCRLLTRGIQKPVFGSTPRPKNDCVALDGPNNSKNLGINILLPYAKSVHGRTRLNKHDKSGKEVPT